MLTLQNSDGVGVSSKLKSNVWGNGKSSSLQALQIHLAQFLNSKLIWGSLASIYSIFFHKFIMWFVHCRGSLIIQMFLFSKFLRPASPRIASSWLVVCFNVCVCVRVCVRVCVCVCV